MAPAGATSTMAREISGETFGRLINLSGRRRFTSQRLVLFAALAARGRSGALETARESLRAFVEAHALLVDGDAELPGLFCDDLRLAYRGPEDRDGQVRRFAELAARALDAIAAGWRSADALLEQLIESTSPLLTVLNALTQVYEDLARRHATQARQRLQSLLGEMQAIARHARFVSFNAQVAAARAPQVGKEFGAVAAEMISVTSRLDELVRQAVQSTGEPRSRT